MDTVRFLWEGCPGLYGRRTLTGEVIERRTTRRGNVEFLVSSPDLKTPRWVAAELTTPVASALTAAELQTLRDIQTRVLMVTPEKARALAARGYVTGRTDFDRYGKVVLYGPFRLTEAGIRAISPVVQTTAAATAEAVTAA